MGITFTFTGPPQKNKTKREPRQQEQEQEQNGEEVFDNKPNPESMDTPAQIEN
jgi:hypothetical protein